MPDPIVGIMLFSVYRAFRTFPERIHLVQANTFRGLPSIIALTFCRLGSRTLFVLRWERLTLCPDTGSFPQIAHFLPKNNTSYVELPKQI